MKKFFLIAMIIAVFAFGAGPANAEYQVTCSWTPSPDAVSEMLLVAGVEQTCDTASAQCSFTMPDLKNEPVVVRSFNSIGDFVDYEMGILEKKPLPNAASNGRLIIIRIIP